MTIYRGGSWDITLIASLFFSNSDYIEIGTLYLEEQIPFYTHSYICFSFCGVEYVFDPALNIIGQKEIYSILFETSFIGKTSIKDAKFEFLEEYKKKVSGDKSKSSLKENNDSLFGYSSDVQVKEWYYPSNDSTKPPIYRKVHAKIRRSNNSTSN